MKWGLEEEWMSFLPSEAEGWERMVITQSCLPVCSEFWVSKDEYFVLCLLFFLVRPIQRTTCLWAHVWHPVVGPPGGLREWEDSGTFHSQHSQGMFVFLQVRTWVSLTGGGTCLSYSIGVYEEISNYTDIKKMFTCIQRHMYMNSVNNMKEMKGRYWDRGWLLLIIKYTKNGLYSMNCKRVSLLAFLSFIHKRTLVPPVCIT